MTHAPGALEWLIILIVSFFFYVIPVIFAVLLLVSHLKLHKSLKQLHKKLDAIKSSAPPAG